MTEQTKSQIELYARCMEAAHCFVPNPHNPDACLISGHLVNTSCLAAGGYEASEEAARRLVRDFAVSSIGAPQDDSHAPAESGEKQQTKRVKSRPFVSQR